MEAIIFYFILSCLPIVVGLLLSHIRSLYRALNGIPKVNTLFPFGSWFGAWNKVIGETDVEHLKKYGKLYWAYDGTRRNLFVADPELIPQILRDPDNNFDSFRAARVTESILGDSLRAIMKKDQESEAVFDETNVNKLIPRIERSAEVLIQELKSKEGTLHAQQVFMQYVGDVIAMTVFGIDLYSDDFKDLRSKFMEHINRVFWVSNPTSFSSVFPYIGRSSLDASILPPEGVSFFSELVMDIVGRKREVSAKTGDIDIIDLLLENQKEKAKSSGDKQDSESVVEEVTSDAEIIVKCLSVILYCVRATETGLSEATYILTNVEEEQEKLVKDIKSFFDTSSELTNGQGSLGAKYLDMFMKEIHRMYPVEYRLVRDCNDGVKLGTQDLPPNISITIPIYAIHHRARYFPEPFSFKPDRFSTENLKEIPASTYLPFGDAESNPGFLGCRLADMFTKIALAYLVANFKLKLPVPHFQAPLTYAKGATEVPSLMPVMFQIEKRD